MLHLFEIFFWFCSGFFSSLFVLYYTNFEGKGIAKGGKKPRNPPKASPYDILPDYEVTSPLKMMLIVRQDLGMKQGKKCAQCGHAAVGLVTDIREKFQRNPIELTARHLIWLEEWERGMVAKIALKAKSLDALVDVHQKVVEKGLPHYLVRDAGRTQIAAGSVTVLGIGPVPADEIDPITRHLKLL